MVDLFGWVLLVESLALNDDRVGLSVPVERQVSLVHCFAGRAGEMTNVGPHAQDHPAHARLCRVGGHVVHGEDWEVLSLCPFLRRWVYLCLRR